MSNQQIMRSAAGAAVAAAGEQTTEVELDGAGRMRAVRQNGRMGGEAMRIDVVYVLHLTATAPHRLLRVQVVGTAVEVVRTGGGSP